MLKLKQTAGWLIALLPALLGLGIFAFPSYRFSAYLSFGIAFLAILWQLLGLLGRRRKRAATILKTMMIVILCAVLLCAAVTAVFIVKGSRGSAETSCGYLIVLGAGVNGTVPSLSLQDRLIAAKNYLDANPETICIVSGGQGPGEDITEAACMAQWLTGHGIDESRVWLEDKATSTQENLALSLALIEEKTGGRPDRAGIVSSEYHLFRAGLMAKKQGIDPVGIPAATHRTSLKINYFLREIAAVWYYLVFGG